MFEMFIMLENQLYKKIAKKRRSSRRKRAPGGGGGGGKGGGGHGGGPTEAIVNVDFDSDARFVKLMMSLPRHIRVKLGHNRETYANVLDSGSRLGFIYTCSFKGVDCSNKR